MPWLPLYADADDFDIVFEWLNGNEEIAFIVSDGPKRWKATEQLSRWRVRDRVCLWHVPSGSLPRLGLTPRDRDGIVQDPWLGWEELRTGADPSVPYFGAGHPGIIWLNVRSATERPSDGIGLSSFEWIGNWYAPIGSRAAEVTQKFWQKLRRWVKKCARRVPRSGPIDGPGAEIWAFPSALAAFQRGIPRAT